MSTLNQINVEGVLYDIEDTEARNDVHELENVLQDILEVIQSGISTSMIIEEIEQLIVSYFENKTVEEVEAE